MERFRMTAAPSILLGSSQILAQEVSLIVSFHLHYFSAVSQNLVPIPGGGHATFRVELFMPTVRM
jgi:hypothetical protein